MPYFYYIMVYLNIKTMTDLHSNFLPESNFLIIETDLDIESFDADTAVYYHSLCHHKLLKIDKEYFEKFHDKEMPTKYTYKYTQSEIWTFDIFDLLSDNLSRLQDYYPTMTEEQILKQLEREENLDENIGY